MDQSAGSAVAVESLAAEKFLQTRISKSAGRRDRHGHIPRPPRTGVARNYQQFVLTLLRLTCTICSIRLR